MINLKEKIYEYAPKGRMTYEKAIAENDYDDAVAFYKDARDNPEKYPELGGEFNNNMNEPVTREFLCQDGEQYDSEMAKNWRDWLFKKIFEGGI